ncbi:MAG: type VI secretion system baseplate subunit TssG [Acidobacteriota bacterium]|nr:type VI secretion system baseplate subunit TssG [Acidobacteriota bacterium]
MAVRPLNELLADEPYRFDFFQAVRLLEKIYPERRDVGADAMPDEEIIRFRSRISLDFPSSAVHEIKFRSDDREENEALEMFVNFMGMIGVSGVLPTHYTELAMDRIRYGDTALWSFTDIFTHRAVSLFFRAWEKYRFPAAYERGNDDFTSYLFDFAGLGTDGLKGRMHLDDETLLPYTGLITQKPHSATIVAQIVADYFGLRAKVLQFFGHWIDLDKESITKLSRANSTLGLDAIVGARVWDQQSKFRLVLGALTFNEFRSFLPNGSACKPLKSIVRFLVGLEFNFDVQLILKANQVPSTILTTRAKRKPMLGWTSWLKSKPFTEDDGQLVLGGRWVE